MSPQRALRFLQRRKKFLEKRMAQRSVTLDYVPDFDKAEVDALNIALASIKLVMSYGMVALTNFGHPLHHGQKDDEKR